MIYAFAWPESRRFIEEVPGGSAFVPSWRSAAQMGMTFAITCLAWVFFRAPSVGAAATILHKIAIDVTTTRPALLYKQTGIWIVVLLAIEWMQRAHANPLYLEHVPRPMRWALYYATAMVMFLFAPMHYTPFIYFQF